MTGVGAVILAAGASTRMSISKKFSCCRSPEGEIDVDTPDDFARLQSTNYSDTSKSADLN
jgi:CTP:molybdopterin cytidylyltransferase MocA